MLLSSMNEDRSRHLATQVGVNPGSRGAAEVFHNRRHRHNSLGMLSPVEYEKLNAERETVA